MSSTNRSATHLFRIASIPGDGIGTEITEAAIQVLQTLSQTVGTFTFDFEEYDWSSKRYKERGYYAPPDGVEPLKKFDAVYFGAVGWPGMIECCNLFEEHVNEFWRIDVPDHISLWQMILPIRTTVHQSYHGARCGVSLMTS